MIKTIFITLFTFFIWTFNKIPVISCDSEIPIQDISNYRFFSILVFISLTVNTFTIYKLNNRVFKIILSFFVALLFLSELSGFIETYKDC